MHVQMQPPRPGGSSGTHGLSLSHQPGESLNAYSVAPKSKVSPFWNIALHGGSQAVRSVPAAGRRSETDRFLHSALCAPGNTSACRTSHQLGITQAMYRLVVTATRHLARQALVWYTPSRACKLLCSLGTRWAAPALAPCQCVLCGRPLGGPDRPGHCTFCCLAQRPGPTGARVRVLLTKLWLRLQGSGSGSSSSQRDVLGSRDPSGSLSTVPITTALAAAAASAPDTHHDAAASGSGHSGDARAEEGSEAAWDAARGALDAPLRARRGVLARLLAPSPGASVEELRCGDAAGMGYARWVSDGRAAPPGSLTLWALALKLHPEGP